MASEVNDAFWENFCRAAKEVNPDAILIGEVWETARHWLDGKKFDSAMNYDFRKHCRRFFAEGSIDAYAFDCRVTHMRMRYREQTVYAQLNLLDSHDVSRFLSLCGGDERRYKLAVLFQMTFPGIPSVFYGDERGICGMLEEEYRAPMAWNKEEDDLFTFYKKAIRLRRDHAVLRQGEYRTLWAERGSGLYLYARETDSDTIMVAMNVSDEACRFPPIADIVRKMRRQESECQEMMETWQEAREESILWQYGLELESHTLAPMGWMVKSGRVIDRKM